MRAVTTIARLTVQEAARRRLLIVFALVTAMLVGLSAWGFDRLAHSAQLTSGELNISLPESLILFMFMFSFVVGLSAVAIASPTVASDLESGVALAVLTRPVRRAEVLLGKWLGLAAVLGGYTAAVCALEFVVVDAVSGFLPPSPVAVFGYLFAEGLVLLTLTLLMSTRLSAMAGGVVGAACFGAAWLAGVVQSLGAVFRISALVTFGKVVRIVLPTDGLWHGAVYYLEPSSYLLPRLGDAGGRGALPFFAQAPPSALYLAWVAVWLIAVLGTAWWSFSRREI